MGCLTLSLLSPAGHFADSKENFNDKNDDFFMQWTLFSAVLPGFSHRPPNTHLGQHLGVSNTSSSLWPWLLADGESEQLGKNET